MFDTVSDDHANTDTIESANNFGADQLFPVNEDADAVGANDFALIARGAINELLDEAIGGEGMSSNRAWVVQHLFNAMYAAEGHSIRTP